LSFAVGQALLSRVLNVPYEVFVLLGDGECNEGSVWESAMSAVPFKLSNLTAIVDLNSMQSDGKTSEVLNLDLASMWKGFGWDVKIVEDGHNVVELYYALTLPKRINTPRVILAKTTKGKGVSFMENNNEWHHNRLSEELYNVAIAELLQKEGKYDRD